MGLLKLYNGTKHSIHFKMLSQTSKHNSSCPVAVTQQKASSNPLLLLKQQNCSAHQQLSPWANRGAQRGQKATEPCQAGLVPVGRCPSFWGTTHDLSTPNTGQGPGHQAKSTWAALLFQPAEAVPPCWDAWNQLWRWYFRFTSFSLELRDHCWAIPAFGTIQTQKQGGEHLIQLPLHSQDSTTMALHLGSYFHKSHMAHLKNNPSHKWPAGTESWWSAPLMFK